MTDDDDAFLDYVAVLASCEPCELPQPDLLRLVILAGFGPETRVYQDVQGQPGRVLVLRDGALEMVRRARTEAGGDAVTADEFAPQARRRNHGR